MDRLTELIKKFDDNPESPPTKPIGKILVIDDDPNITQGLERTLKLRNHQVVQLHPSKILATKPSGSFTRTIHIEISSLK